MLASASPNPHTLKVALLSSADCSLLRAVHNHGLQRRIPNYALDAMHNDADYACLGCVVKFDTTVEGHRLLTKVKPLTAAARKRFWQLMFSPRHKAAAEELLETTITVQAYRPQATEANVQGPGGVVSFGTNSSAQLALLFWEWQDEASFCPSIPEVEAQHYLWVAIQKETASALKWLRLMDKTDENTIGEHRIPMGIRDQLYQLFGTPAWRRLVEEKLGLTGELTALNTLKISAIVSANA